MAQHFLSLSDLAPSKLREIIGRAIELKSLWRSSRQCPQIMRNRTLALVFEKSSTRTRVSFEAAANQLGGSALFISPADSQLNRGESIPDTARVLSSMVDIIAVRTGAHSIVETFSDYSTVPVVNGLSDRFHPCQILADIQTWQESRGSIEGITAAWLGDGNNVCHSWINAARFFNFNLRISTPAQFQPEPELVAAAGSAVELADSPTDAVTNADIVVTDTWASMGQESEKEVRCKIFKPYQVTAQLMRHAAPDAMFMHCLPAYRGLEVADEVIDGPQSVVWTEAENRLHAQKALLEYLLCDSAGQDD